MDDIIKTDGWKFQIGDKKLTKAFIDEESKTVFFEMDMHDVQVLKFLKDSGLLRTNKKIAAIKAVRAEFSCSLKAAKDAIEALNFDWCRA